QGAPSTRALMRWMDEHGRLPAWLRDWPWEQWEPGWAMEASPAVQAEMVRIEEAVEAFLRTRTKAEVYREGVQRRILVAPVATVADIAADPQLAFRDSGPSRTACSGGVSATRGRSRGSRPRRWPSRAGRRSPGNTTRAP